MIPVASNKRCSIVLVGVNQPAMLSQYVCGLAGAVSMTELEIIVIGDGPLDIAGLRLIIPSLKIITARRGLKFEQLCMQAAGQAQGEYVFFARGPISEPQLAAALAQAETTKVNIFVPPEKNYILVKRIAFVKEASFERLIKEENKWQFAELKVKCGRVEIDLSQPFEEIIFAANKNRLLLTEKIDGYLSSGNSTQINFYLLLFLKSLKEYLSSGIEFANIDQINEFYRGAHIEIDGQVPWFVALLQSYWHLRRDRKGFPQHHKIERQTAAVILVSVYNETRFTELCFRAIRKFTRSPHYILVVNNSSDNMEKFRNFVVNEGLVDEWFDSGCNLHSEGLQRSLSRVRQFRYLVTLDSDAIVIKHGWLSRLIEELTSKEAGLIGPQTFPRSNTIKGYGVHPCCMVIDQNRIGPKFQIDFGCQWPWDSGHLLTWDCLAHHIGVVKVTHEIDGNQAIGSSLINKSVRHYWYTSRILNLDDDAVVDKHKVRQIREKLDMAYESAELQSIKNYQVPPKHSRPHTG